MASTHKAHAFPFTTHVNGSLMVSNPGCHVKGPIKLVGKQTQILLKSLLKKLPELTIVEDRWSNFSKMLDYTHF
jgi:hypothetical protein